MTDKLMEEYNKMVVEFEPMLIGVGVGHKNATKREHLPAVLRVATDREARNKLNHLKKAGFVIVNTGKGNGYFVPEFTNEDYTIALQYYLAEKSKADDILKTLKPLEKWLRVAEGVIK